MDFQKLNIDIRAPRRFKLLHITGRHWPRKIAVISSDCLALAIAWYWAGAVNQSYSPLPEALMWWTWFGIPSLFWLFAAITLLFFAYGRLYRTLSHNQNYVRAGQLISLVYLLSLVISYFYNPKLDLPRSLFFAAWSGSLVLVIGFRLLLALFFREWEHTAVSVFIIASAPRLEKLAQMLQRRSRYKVVGGAFAMTANSGTTFDAILRSGATEVLVEDLPQAKLASSLYWRLRRAGIELRLLPSSREMLYRRGRPEVFAGLPTLRIETPLLIGWDYRFKRWCDVLAAFFGIILLTPLWIVVAIAIKATSPGPILFRQARIGLHGKVFHMWKFRTMGVDAALRQAELEAQNHSQDGVMFKLKRDPRITPIGHFLRRSSIDELPQLFNVLLGQMSMVGPRPLPLRDVERFDPWHHIRHQVLPGITGLWQISGRANIENFDDAAGLDLYYIDNWSLNMDLDILVDTIRIVCFGHGAY